MAKINKDKKNKPSKTDKRRLLKMFAEKGFDASAIFGDENSAHTREEIVHAFVQWRKSQQLGKKTGVDKNARK